MMGIDLLSTTWTNAQLLAWKELVDPILCGTSLAMCIIAQIMFYIFPRLRVFPRSILSWVNIYNLWYMPVIIIKWSPRSVLHKSWVLNLKAGSPICKAGIFLDNVAILGPVCCTLLLCLTMFLSIVMRIEIEGKQTFFWSYLAFATLYPVIISSVAAFAFQQDTAFGVCIIGKGGDFPIRMTYIVVFFAQVVLFAITMFYIKRVFTTVKNSVTTSNSFPMTLLFVRFGCMFFSQTYGLVPTQVAFLFPDPPVSTNAIFIRIVTITRMTGPILDALVLILGNTDFIEWIRKQYRLRLKRRITITPDASPNINNNTVELLHYRSIQIAEEGILPKEEIFENTRLSDDGARMGKSSPRHMSIIKKTSLEEQESSDIGDGIISTGESEMF